MAAMSTTPQPAPRLGLPVQRVEGLTDALFAIVMTLLVLSIQVPDIPDNLVDSELTDKIVDLWPQLFSYFLTFTILGFHWVAHHHIYSYFQFATRALIWLNFGYLMFIALLPFTTDLIGDYPRKQVAVLFYGGNLLLISLFLELQWWYGSHHARLIDPDISPHTIRSVTIRTFVSPAGFILALAVSFISTELSIVVFILVVVAHAAAHYYAMRQARASALAAGREYAAQGAPVSQPEREAGATHQSGH
jgi:uncharacterized membrane protein